MAMTHTWNGPGGTGNGSNVLRPGKPFDGSKFNNTERWVSEGKASVIGGQPKQGATMTETPAPVVQEPFNGHKNGRR